MRSAGAEPIIRKAFEGQDSYRLYRAPDRSAVHDRDRLSATLMMGGTLVGSAGPVTVEGALVLPRCPDDARQAVRQRDSGFVVTALFFAVQAPSASIDRGEIGRA